MAKTTHTTSQEQVTSSEQTRAALIGAALKLFGRQGYDGTSTREIANAANANIGSIAYHFGGKEGLRLAVADHIVDLMQGVAAKAVEGLPQPARPNSPEAVLARMLEGMYGFFVARPEAGEIVPFILREMGAPSPAFLRVYEGVLEPIHRRLCGVWEAATGEPAESEQTRIAVFMLIGQVVYFRLAREAVRRRMGWQDVGPAEVSTISAVAIKNLEAVLAARKEGKS